MNSLIKLPDFRKCSSLISLHNQMGVESTAIKLHEIIFARKVKKKIKRKLTDNEIQNFLDTFNKGLVFNNNDVISSNESGLLQVNGHSCCIYIKRQHAQYNSNYRYHLFECETIQSMIAEGRKNRYVATARHDGKFVVIKQYHDKFEETIEELKLCAHCYKILINKGMAKNFNLKVFFEKNMNHFEHNFFREETVIADELYSPDQLEIATRFKEQVEYKCNECHLDCSKNEYLLHLHHIDGDGQNNVHSNLRVLCADCHSRQKSHSHMLGKFKEQIAKCIELRKEQGFF